MLKPSVTNAFKWLLNYAQAANFTNCVVRVEMADSLIRPNTNGAGTGFSQTNLAYKAGVTIPPLLWVTVFLLAPYAILFCYSFWSLSPAQVIVHNWNLQNYLQLARNPIYLQVLFRSMRIASLHR